MPKPIWSITIQERGTTASKVRWEKELRKMEWVKGVLGNHDSWGVKKYLGLVGGWPPLIDEPESSVGGDTVRVSQPGWRAYSPSPQDKSSRSRKSEKKVQKCKNTKISFS